MGFRVSGFEFRVSGSDREMELMVLRAQEMRYLPVDFGGSEVRVWGL